MEIQKTETKKRIDLDGIIIFITLALLFLYIITSSIPSNIFHAPRVKNNREIWLIFF